MEAEHTQNVAVVKTFVRTGSDCRSRSFEHTRELAEKTNSNRDFPRNSDVVRRVKRAHTLSFPCSTFSPEGSHLRRPPPDCMSVREDAGMPDEARAACELPKQLRGALSAINVMSTEATRSRQASTDRGVFGLTLPVHEDDVGSLIAQALLSRQCHEQMTTHWQHLNGGRPCCPLAMPLGACSWQQEEWSCFASAPACLHEAMAARETSSGSFATTIMSSTSQTVRPGGGHARASSSGNFSNVSHSRHPSSSTGETYLPPQHNPPKLASLHWKRLPSNAYGEHGPLVRHDWEIDWEQRGVRRVLTAPTSAETVRVDFSDQVAKYSVVIHNAPQYHMLRHWLCGDDLNFVRSIHRCTCIKPSGGKSLANFFMSRDGRFLLKSVNRHEFKKLTSLDYSAETFWYVDQVLFDKLPSVLAQVVGAFTVSVTRRHRSKERIRNFIVQRNLRYSIQVQNRPHFCFDLKGTNRKMTTASSAADEGDEGSKATAVASSTEGSQPPIAPLDSAETSASRTKTVLWDQNFREWTDGKPLCLASQDLQYLEAAVWNDTQLLSKHCLMDYSLLLASVPPEVRDGTTSNEPGTLALGIIDYLRPYTWDKQMEKVVKGLAFNNPGLPTVIPPIDYARRFLNAMGTFFVAETLPSSSSRS
eukprot:TRINITY_DN33580_c0_g1_i1.p1 TRINITY_DN33580_c0_g1~~TRINITY_DN33580_c0_g1_i1.p1  ORF type:complete len:742 (-),score=104.01 TRINITY_DN33580_c0_g1_i1:21-1955(-)